LAPAAKAQYAESVLYNFTAAGPHTPYAGVIFDSHGNLYGTTINSNVPGASAAFELSPPSSGSGPWTETTLAALGSAPKDSGVVFDSHGNLYGTNSQGGQCGYGDGYVYELSPPSSGSAPWTETWLRSFCGYPDGAFPNAGVISDSHGNLYGTAPVGGTYLGGIVFELSPPSSGSGHWTGQNLYNFMGGDGAIPLGGLVFGPSGNLYGTTNGGGSSAFCPIPAGCGVVFELYPRGYGKWGEAALYSFCTVGSKTNCADGSFPISALVIDSHGNLYGTTTGGGGDVTSCPPIWGGGCGVVFELSPPTGGSDQWTETVLHSFTGGTDGGEVSASLILDSQGNLYGTTPVGGNTPSCCGVVFELSPPSSGSGPWTETVLYTFSGGSDGSLPHDGVIFDSKGNLYGTTAGGGTGGGGVVFELSPPQLEITASTSSISIVGGQQGTVQLTVNVTAGTPDAASLTCTGLPPGASCSFSPPSVTAYPTTVNLTISTAANDAGLRPSHPSRWAAIALMLPGLLLLPVGQRRRQRAVGLLAGVVLLLIFSLAGCGGSGSSAGAGGSQNYIVVVTASAAGIASGTTTINLTVTN
jgi:uncharacterized repeat protein (TIGR03803 family)